MPRPIAVALLAAALAAPTGPAPALPRPGLDLVAEPGDTVPGELLVKFRTGADARRRATSLAAVGHTALADLEGSGWVHARVGPGQSLAEALAAYATDPDVEWAQPNFVYRASAVPNDPSYPLLWGWKNTGQALTGALTQPSGTPIAYTSNNPPPLGGSDMRLEKAWDQLTDCSPVVVAVVDSGVNYTHEDLAANLWDGGASWPNHGWNFVPPAGDDPMDLNGHGTHVAGTIGAVGNNATGTVGVCWKASLMAVRVLDEGGAGSTAGIIQGIGFAVARGAKVINMSLGGAGGFDQAFSDAITAAQAADVVVVVAAGNSAVNNETTAHYPCNFTHSNLLCVAALDQAYQLASFSNWGSTSVDIGAPGTNVVSTWPGPTVGDALNQGWTGSSTTAGLGGGWAYWSNPNVQALVDPGAYGIGTYQNGTDDRVWKSFDLTGASAAALQTHMVFDLAVGDSLEVAVGSVAGDPFATGTSLGGLDGVTTYPKFVPVSAEVSSCIGATCTIGFRLQSDLTPQASKGMVIAGFSITTVERPGRAYNTENGTSMAAPAVAGLAALLRAYNPGYTATDVVASIEGGGRPAPALAGRTTTGRAADAMGSLAFIAAPTGLSATVR